MSPDAGATSLVAIHQPNYLPWLGYFDKILRCDVFVFLDQVQMSVQSYTQRVRVLNQGAPTWLTVPILKKGLFGQEIRDVDCNSTLPWRRKHLGTLQASYGRHPHFREVFPDLSDVLISAPDRLGALNEHLIRFVAERLGARCRFVCGGELGVGDRRASELLAATVRAVGGTTYLYGGGGTKYQEAEPFESAGVALEAQRFEQRSYAQVGCMAFIPGLSIVDALFNLGYEGTRLLLSGV